ncbi:MAG: S41 family peptidase [Oscillospiraceae bacterium]|nr:S41 family peptidase [Oscillospiraceae bacterium]
MKKVIVSLLALSVVMGLAKPVSADVPSDTSVVSEDTSAAPADTSAVYTETQTLIHVFDKEKTEPIDVRFYEGVTEIPYIRLTDYYSLLMGKKMELTEHDGETFTFTSAAGASAVIDTEKDTLYSDDFDNFINTSIKKQDDIPNVYIDGAPFIRVASVETDKDPLPVEINFADYSIDLHADENDIWLPALTASDLFSGVTMLQCMYDGSEFHLLDSNGKYTPFGLLEDEDYMNSISVFSKDGKRSKALAEYGYNEFCFVYDHYFGYPGRVEVENEVAEKGLDETLKTYDDFTAQAREWLMSEDPAAYGAGTLILCEYLYDGGHSSYEYMPYLYYLVDEDYNDKMTELLDSIGFEFDNYTETGDRVAKIGTLSRQRNEAWGEDKLVISGDTAVYSFDSFMYDVDGWNEYYNNGGELPDDAAGGLKRALDTAQADPNVKYFILDISINLGGSGDVVGLISAVMTGRAEMLYTNMLNGQFTTVTYDSDTDLDRVFDEKDKTGYDFKFGIITSDVSFSCGNLLPSVAHDNGIALFGERSGGGACAVLPLSTPEGGYYQISSALRLADKNGESIDSGIPVDIDLVRYDDKGDEDYSAFYDIPTLSRSMAQYYGTTSSFDEIAADSDADEAVLSDTPAEEAAPAEAPSETAPAPTGNPSAGNAAAVMFICAAAAAGLKLSRKK